MEASRRRCRSDDGGVCPPRRAPGDEAPTAAEIAAVRELTVQVNAAADRIGARLDRTIARVDELLDPAREQARRDEIAARIEAAGTFLDLDALADAAR